MFIRFSKIITKNRIKNITKFKKNFNNFYTVFLIDSCKIDSLVPSF